MDERPVNALTGRIFRRVTAVIAVLALLLAGCSKGGGGGGGESDNVLTIGTTYYISSLNPFVGIETQDSTAYSMLYPQLVQYGPGLKLEGDWAQSWDETADGRTITFKLREGNGQTVSRSLPRMRSGLSRPSASTPTAQRRPWPKCWPGSAPPRLPTRARW